MTQRSPAKQQKAVWLASTKTEYDKLQEVGKGNVKSISINDINKNLPLNLIKSVEPPPPFDILVLGKKLKSHAVLYAMSLNRV